MYDDFKFYRLSGKANLMGPFLGIALATLVGIPLSYFYAYVAHYIPMISFLLSLGFAFCLCVGYGIGDKLGHNRNRTLSFLGSLSMSIIALYLAWLAFFFMLSEERLPYWTFLINPKEVLSLIVKYSLDSKNGILYAILEVLGYLFLFLSGAVLDPDSVYCEECCIWLEPIIMPSAISMQLEKDMEKTLLTGTIHWIDKIELTSAPSHINFSFTHCEQCNRLCTLTATKVDIVEKEDEGERKIEKQETTIFKNLLIDYNTKQKILKKLEDLEKRK